MCNWVHASLVAIFNDSNVQVLINMDKVPEEFFIFDLFDCNHKSTYFVLISRAWRRILNFSEDQLNRPEAATVLWRWVMDRIRMKRKMVSQTFY